MAYSCILAKILKFTIEEVMKYLCFHCFGVAHTPNATLLDSKQLVVEILAFLLTVIVWALGHITHVSAFS